MKRCILSSLVLALVIFNAFGYYVLLGFEQAQARHVEIAGLPDEAFEVIKLPASLYVHLEDSDFEVVDHQFTTRDGRTYNSVKQRIVNDSLEIYCLRNFRSEQLTELSNDLATQHDGDSVRGKTGFPAPQKSISKAFFKDYLSNPAPLAVVRPFFVVKLQKNTKSKPQNDDLPLSPFFHIHAPPPNFGA